VQTSVERKKNNGIYGIAPALSIPNIGRYLATRQELSLNKAPDSGRRGRAKVRVDVFAQPNYFLFGADPLGELKPYAVTGGRCGIFQKWACGSMGKSHRKRWNRSTPGSAGSRLGALQFLLRKGILAPALDVLAALGDENRVSGAPTQDVHGDYAGAQEHNRTWFRGCRD
jgi:hypothetical protein